MAKAANNLRFSVNGLTLGYYSGSSAVLRSSLDALEFAALFESDPSQLAIWLRNEFSQSRSQGDLNRLRSEQSMAAKSALLRIESHPRAINDGLNEFWKGANRRIHATFQGLADEFGVQLEDLVPDYLEETFVKSNYNVDKALETYVLFSKYGTNLLAQHERAALGPGESIPIAFHNLLDETT